MANVTEPTEGSPRPKLRWTDHEVPGVPADEAPPHDIGGRYVIQQLLGRGGMASVYLGRDRRLKRPIAIKILRRGIEVERFEREAVILADLQHDHIAEVYDSGILDDGRPYFVTQYLDGVNLGRLLAVAPLPWQVVLEIGLQLASALRAVHQRGVIHRDIKPENIMLLRSRRGELCVKLVDFGVARLTTRWDEVAERDTPPKERRRTLEGLALGTDGYISLAASMGQLSPEADVFALGVTLFKLCTGQHPYEQGLEAIQRRGVALDLAKVIVKAIDFDPAREVGSAEALHTALTRVAAAHSQDAIACECREYLARVFFRDEPSAVKVAGVAPDAATAAPPNPRPPDGVDEALAPFAEKRRLAAPNSRAELRQWVGRVLDDRFELDGVLGDGGAAVVFDAWDMHFRQRAALKVLLPEQAHDPAALQRFEHEARVLMKVRQEHLVAAFHRGTTREGLHYLALEHLDGAHLGKVRGAAWLHWPAVVETGLQAARALAALHRAGVLHRDVVPTNLVWVRDPRRQVLVKLIDASHCKLLPAWYERERRDGTRPRDRLVTREGLIFGDRRFRPPEAGLKPPHPREDIFGLGVTLYLLLTGKYPYPAGMPAFGQHLDPVPLAEANPNAAVPAELAQLVLDAIQLDPEMRPECAEEFFDQWMGVAGDLDANAFLDRVLTGAIKFADCPEARNAPDGAIRRPEWNRLLYAAAMDSPKVERVVPVRIPGAPIASPGPAHSPALAPPPALPETSAEPPAMPLPASADGSRARTKPTGRPPMIARAVLSHSAVAIVTAGLLGLVVGPPGEQYDGSSPPAIPDGLLAQVSPAPVVPRPPALAQPATVPALSDSEQLHNALSVGCPDLRGSFRLSVRLENHQARLLRVNSAPLDVKAHPEHSCLEGHVGSVRLMDTSAGIKLFVVQL